MSSARTGEVLKTSKGELWTEGEILFIRLSGQVGALDIEEVAKAGKEITNKNSNIKYNIIDISDVKGAPFGARKAASECFSGPAVKIAFVCKNPVARIIGSFFLRRYKIPIPTKIFSSEDDASRWLKG